MRDVPIYHECCNSNREQIEVPHPPNATSGGLEHTWVESTRTVIFHFTNIAISLNCAVRTKISILWIPAGSVAAGWSIPPSPLPRARCVFVVGVLGNGEHTDATTADPWSAAFSSTASFVQTAGADQKHRSTFAPRGCRQSILRTVQVSICQPPCRLRRVG